jgi:hypothetical protein
LLDHAEDFLNAGMGRPGQETTEKRHAHENLTRIASLGRLRDSESC